MANDNKKGITVKVDAELHAEIKAFIEANGMTMAEFVAKALDDELHPKIQIKEEKSIAKDIAARAANGEDSFDIDKLFEEHDFRSPIIHAISEMVGNMPGIKHSAVHDI